MSMIDIAARGWIAKPSPYPPSLRVERFACGWYGVGHTARRQPGDMRGTVIGKKGRFKGYVTTRGGDV
jgi:hypothetical protein